MENTDFAARSFYKKHIADKEKEFTTTTGLTLRRDFQAWNEGLNDDDTSDEVFYIKTASQKECFGIECGGMITYLLPISTNESILLLFDRSFAEILSEIAGLSEIQFEVFSKYIPTLMRGLNNSSSANYNDYCLFVDEGMACFAKSVMFSPFQSEDLLDDYLTEVLPEALDLLEFRILCSEEVASFEGYTSEDMRQINIKEGLSIVKYGADFLKECCLQSLIS